MGLWVTPQTTHITSTHVVERKRRPEATEEVREDRPVTGDFDGRSATDGPATGFLDGCSGDGWLGDGQEYRGVVGESNNSEHENQPLNQSSQMALSELLLPRRSTRLIQTARARGIDRTGPVDLAGKGRTCMTHRSLPLSTARAATGPRCERGAAQPDR